MKAFRVVVSVALLSAPAVHGPVFADPPAVEPQLALQYDFYDLQGGQVPDGSGHGNAGTILAGAVVSGKRKPAVQLDGTGMVTSESLGRSVDLAGRAMTVGAMCRPGTPDGVVASMGDSRNGFRLYLKDGLPHFAVRSEGALREVVDTEPVEVGRWVHLAGVIGADGQLSLLVNAFPAAKAAGPSFLARTPSGRFAVGADTEAPAAGAALLPSWHGLLEDVRVYLGEVDREAHRELLADWANRPGCGCRK